MKTLKTILNLIKELSKFVKNCRELYKEAQAEVYSRRKETETRRIYIDPIKIEEV